MKVYRTLYSEDAFIYRGESEALYFLTVALRLVE
jgi:hypothetical protein